MKKKNDILYIYVATFASFPFRKFEDSNLAKILHSGWEEIFSIQTSLVRLDFHL